MVFFSKWTDSLAKEVLVKLNNYILLPRQWKTDVLVMISHGLKQKEQPAFVSFFFFKFEIKTRFFLIKAEG